MDTCAVLPFEEKRMVATSDVAVGGKELLDQFKEPWHRLCHESGADIFLTPEWIGAYLNAFEPDTEVVVFTVSAGERLLAILPLTRKWIWFRGIRLRELKGAANVHSVAFDVLRVPGPEGEEAVAAIWGQIRRFPGWHVLHLPSFREGGASQALLDCAARDGYATLTDVFADSPFVPLNKTKNGQVDVTAGASRHFRHELRRWRRKMETEIEDRATFVRHTNAEPQMLGRFFRLEAAGWKGEGGTAIQCSPETLRFYGTVAEIAAMQGRFALHSLEIGNRFVAGCFGVETSNVFHGLKLAYDEDFRRYGLGHLLAQSLLEDCAARGMGEVSLGGKSDDYKRHWTREFHRNLNGFVFSHDLRSQIAHYERSKLFPTLRRWVEALRSRLHQAGDSKAQRQQ
jgi:CelD/BcsL family acetyltransferase involved in cellulose biosynthesis